MTYNVDKSYERSLTDVDVPKISLKYTLILHVLNIYPDAQIFNRFALRYLEMLDGFCSPHMVQYLNFRHQIL